MIKEEYNAFTDLLINLGIQHIRKTVFLDNFSDYLDHSKELDSCDDHFFWVCKTNDKSMEYYICYFPVTGLFLFEGYNSKTKEIKSSIKKTSSIHFFKEQLNSLTIGPLFTIKKT